MATLNFYYKDVTAAGSTLHRSLQEGGTIAAAQSTTGWQVAQNAAGLCCVQKGGTEVPRNSSTPAWTTEIQPAGVPYSLGDCWRTENRYNGTFTAGTWAIALPFRSTHANYTGRFKIHIRVWKTGDPDGAIPTELTTSPLVTSASTSNVTTTGDYVFQLNWQPGAVTLANQYLFFQVGIEITQAGTGNTQDVLFRLGSNYAITTPNFTSAAATRAYVAWAQLVLPPATADSYTRWLQGAPLQVSKGDFVFGRAYVGWAQLLIPQYTSPQAWLYSSELSLGFGELTPVTTAGTVTRDLTGVALSVHQGELWADEPTTVFQGELTPWVFAELLGQQLTVQFGEPQTTLDNQTVRELVGYELAVATSPFAIGGVDYGNVTLPLVPYIELSVDGPEVAKEITGASNAVPIVLTVASHGYEAGDEIQVSGVLGNTAANGQRTVGEVLSNSTFNLHDLFGNDVVGNGSYISGGATQRWVWDSYQTANVKTSARYARARYMTDGTALVSSLGSVRVNVVTRQEGGIVAAEQSGPRIVTFSNRYTKAISATATAIDSAAPLYTVIDNIEVDGARGLGTGQMLLFDGIDDHVEIADVAALRAIQTLTVEAWVKVTAPLPARYQNIVRKDTETGTVYSWGLRVTSTGRVEAIYNHAGTVYSALSSSPVPLSQWMHYALVITEEGLYYRLWLYIDGISVAHSDPIPMVYAPTGRMGIGATPPGIPTSGLWAEWFAGRIDEVRVWNAVRTPTEIADCRNVSFTDATSPTLAEAIAAGLVGYWKLDNDALTGTAATDSSATGNDGTVSGAKWRPVNGMDLYTFDSSRTQVSNMTAWNFVGV